jgi:protoporphyrinogen oxidase
MKTIAVLGSGISALGAAQRLAKEKVEVTLYDKNAFFGGHTNSLRYKEGFVFDMGPHVSFTSDKRIEALLADNVDGDFDTHKYRFNNYWEGHWMGHPAQTNLHGLPTDIVVKIIADFVEQGTRQEEIRTYEDWLRVAYGRTFAERFPGQYTFKYHTTNASNLTTDWMGPRMYRPKLEEIVRGALTSETPNVHYIQSFRYPRRGGFAAYLQKWARAATINLSHEVVRVDPGSRSVSFRNGRTIEYGALISSIPLTDLIPLISGVPDDIRAAAKQLACSACVLVNIGVARADVANAHVSYFYDLDLVFPRTSYPHLMAETNVPPGCSSIQVEIYFSPKYRPFTGEPQDYIEPAIRDLIRCGILREDDRLLLKAAVYCPFANIIFDHDRKAALAAVHGYMDDVQIGHCGRFGDWGYLWTDDSIKSGEAAAEKALTNQGVARAAPAVSRPFTSGA